MDNNGNNKIKLNYANLTQEQKAKISNQYDNFLEALFLSPQLFSRDVLKFMKAREEKLKSWRNISQIIGGVTIFSSYAIYRLKSWKGFYFKNVCIGLLGAGLLGFLIGRFVEYYSNRRMFKDKLREIAMNYNITDEEIYDLQLKATERMLEKNKVEGNKSSLDKIKFKL